MEQNHYNRIKEVQSLLCNQIHHPYYSHLNNFSLSFLKQREVMTVINNSLCTPDGHIMIEPQVGEEALYTAIIDHQKVFEEPQNFDAVGHYSRPDVLQLKLNRSRLNNVSIKD